MAALRGRLALGFGVDFAAEQHCYPGEVEPEGEDDHASESAVGLAVRPEFGDIEREAERGQQEDGGADQASGADPLPARR